MALTAGLEPPEVRQFRQCLICLTAQVTQQLLLREIAGSAGLIEMISTVSILQIASAAGARKNS